MMGRCPSVRMAWELPLMKGPGLVVDSSSFVEAISPMGRLTDASRYLPTSNWSSQNSC